MKLSRPHFLAITCSMRIWKWWILGRHKHSDHSNLDDFSLQRIHPVLWQAAERQTTSVHSKTWDFSDLRLVYDFLRYSLPFFYPSPMEWSFQMPRENQTKCLVSHLIYEPLLQFLFSHHHDGCRLWFLFVCL